jgi:DNA-binding NarL/FixJ family response regulator
VTVSTAFPSNSAHILIVEDEPSLRELLARWLTHFGHHVRAAADGIEALGVLRAEHIDVVITDLKMPGLNGLQLLAVAKELAPTTEVIVLTGHGTMQDAIEALRGGRAFDFLQKPIQDFGQFNRIILEALRQVRARAANEGQEPWRAGPHPLEGFSERERTILALLIDGLDNPSIGQRLFISEKTVKNNLTRIYEKLQVANRAQAIVRCRQLGIG